MSDTTYAFRTGKKVYLRAINEEDVPVLTQHINDEETNVFLTITHPMSRAQERAWLTRSEADASQVTFAIVCNESHELIGTIGLGNIHPVHRTATAGCALRNGFWSKGYGSDALDLLLEYAFGTLNLRKINAGAWSFNTRSIALQKKVGFREEGILKAQRYRNGEYVDEVRLGLFKEDFYNT